MCLRSQTPARLAAALLIAAAVLWSVAGSHAEQFGRQRGFSRWIQSPSEATLDGRFQFCRIAFRGGGFRGSGWAVDSPQADIHLSIRLSELTKTPVSFDGHRNPRHFVVQLTDDELFLCPFVMMTEPGTAFFDEAEAARLREYLLKGGFLWADDFWGSYEWAVWAGEIAKALPPSEYPIVDLPRDHPIFRTLFEVTRVPQIPSINFWYGSGGGTSERGGDSAVPYLRAILDEHGRIMVLITFNTDLGDSWEREADDPTYFYNFSVDGYALGINVVLYALTH